MSTNEQNYRPLGPDEVIQAGDEYKHLTSTVWGLCIASTGETPKEWPVLVFRRPIPAEPEPKGDEKWQEYVLGFAFSAPRERIVLIRKAKPEWQRGKLNGIGGKIESRESKYTAMAREFKDETGLQTTGEQWEYFCRMEGSGFVVHCFATVADIHSCKTTESEKVEVFCVDEIKHLRKEMVENLPWLIYLACDYLEDNRPGFTVAAYDQPFPFGEIETLRAQLAEAEKEAKRLKDACSRTEHDVQQIAGKALGYPWFKDDQKNFPGATEADGVCVGEHVAASIVSELANKYADAEKKRVEAEEKLAPKIVGIKCEYCGFRNLNILEAPAKCLQCDSNEGPFTPLYQTPGQREIVELRARAETAERDAAEAIHAGQQQVCDISGQLAEVIEEREQILGEKKIAVDNGLLLADERDRLRAELAKCREALGAVVEMTDLYRLSPKWREMIKAALEGGK